MDGWGVQGWWGPGGLVSGGLGVEGVKGMIQMVGLKGMGGWDQRLWGQGVRVGRMGSRSGRSKVVENQSFKPKTGICICQV